MVNFENLTLAPRVFVKHLVSGKRSYLTIWWSKNSLQENGFRFILFGDTHSTYMCFYVQELAAIQEKYLAQIYDTYVMFKAGCNTVNSLLTWFISLIEHQGKQHSRNHTE